MWVLTKAVEYCNMKIPHKNERDILLLKSEEGKRTFLCGNKMSHRLPSFGVESTNFDLETKEQKQSEKLSKEQLLKLQELQTKMAKVLLNCWLDEIKKNGES